MPINEYEDLLAQLEPTPGKNQVDEYDRLAGEIFDPQKPALQNSMFRAVATDPDMRAKAMKIADQAKLPIEYVERNFDKLSRDVQVESTDYDKLINESPKLAKWLENPDNMAVARDDVGAISKIEATTKDYSMLKGLYSSIQYGMANAYEGIAKTPAMVSDIAAGVHNKFFPGELSIKTPEIYRDNLFTKALQESKDYYKQPELEMSITQEIGKGNYSKAGQVLAHQFFANAPSQAIILMSSMLGAPEVGALYAGTSTAAASHDENLKKGIPMAQSLGDSAIKGGIEAGFESLGTLGILKHWDGKISQMYGKQVSREVIGDFFKSLTYSMAAEGNEELLTSIAQDLTDYVTGVDSKSLDGIFQRAADAGLLGAASGGGMTAPTGVLSGASRLQMAQQVKLQQEFLTALGESAGSTKLKSRLPEKQKELVEQITKGTPVENIFIPIEAVDTYFQSKNVSIAKAMTDLGILEQYETAKQIGAPLQIPLATAVDKMVGTEHWSGLLNDIKFHEKDLTANELKRMLEEEANRVDTKPSPEEERHRSEHQQIIDDIRQKLETAGRSKTEAETLAKMYAERYQARAQRLDTGKSALQLYQEDGPRIQQMAREQALGAMSQPQLVENQLQGLIPFREAIPVTDLGNQPAINADAKEVRAKAFEAGKTVRGTVKNAHGNSNISITSEGTKKTANLTLRPEQLYAFQNLPQLIENAEFVREESDREGGSSVKFEYYYAPFRINGEEFTAKIVVRNSRKGKTFYALHTMKDDPRSQAPTIYRGEPAEPTEARGSTLSKADLLARINRGRQISEFFQSPINIAPAFYSKLERLIEQKMGNSATIDQVRALMKDIKEEERKWSGIDEFLKGKTKVSKSEMLDFLRGNQLEIKEVVKGENDVNAEFNSAWADFESAAHEYTDLSDAEIARLSTDIRLGRDVQLPEEIRGPGERFIFATHMFDKNERNDTKFSKYTLPGGENYREVLFTLPEKENDSDRRFSELSKEWHEILSKYDQDEKVSPEDKKRLDEISKEQKKLTDGARDESYHSSHWDEPNVLAHVRLNDRIDADGKKVLFIEEIQSDWHQEGRKKGYRGEEVKGEVVYSPEKDAQFPYAVMVNGREYNRTRSEEIAQSELLEGLEKEKEHRGKVPDAPFKKTWHEFALKRIIRMAAEGGYDAISWTTGEQQAERYDLSQQLSKIEYRKVGEDSYEIAVFNTNGSHLTSVPSGPHTAEALSGILGKEVSEKITQSIGENKTISWKKRLSSSEEIEYIDNNSDWSITKVTNDHYEIHDSAGSYRGSGNSLAEAKAVAAKHLDIGAKTLSGLDLKIGGEGMKGFYDKIVPDFLNKFGKKYGAKVVKAGIDVKGNPADYLDIRSASDGTWQIVEPSGAVYKDDTGGYYEGYESQQEAEEVRSQIDLGSKFRGSTVEAGKASHAWELRFTTDEGKEVTHEFNTKEDAEQWVEGVKSTAKGFINDPTITSTVQKTPVHTFPLTPELKKAALEEGFSLFQDSEGGPRGRISFGNLNALIELGQTADASTFIHETGHLWLNEMAHDIGTLMAIPEAERTEKQKALIEDGQTILNWLGVESWEQIGRDQHEQWARGFEAYTMEGKSPSEKLRKAFARFRVWLTNIYKSIGNLGVILTPEIRGVMDRMVATEEQIAQAETQVSPLFEDPWKFGFTGAKAEAYIRARNDAKEAAEEELNRKLMKEYLRAQTEWWKDEREKVRSQFEAQVNAEPIQRVISILQKNTNPDGTALNTPAIKLSKDAIVSLFGKDILKKLPRGVVDAKDGLSPDIVAGMLGYESGAVMVDQMVKAPNRLQEIERLTDERMRELYPDLLNSTTLPEEAIKAVHNEERSTLLKMELEHLASNDIAVLKNVIKKVSRVVPTDKSIKDQARKTVGAKKVSDLSPRIYQAAEAKAAKEAGELLAKGDLDGAFQAKQRQWLAHEMYRAAIDAQESMDKFMELAKKIARKDADLTKSRDIDLVNAARAILAAHAIGKSDKTAAEYLEPIRRYDPDTYETVAALVLSVTKNPMPYQEMSFEDFTAMKDAVESIWELSRTNRQMEIDGQKRDRNEVKLELQSRVVELSNGDKRKGYDKKVSEWDKAIIGFMGVRAALRRVESWVDAMDGGDPNGVFRKYIWNPISEAVTEYRTQKKIHIRKYVQIIQAHEFDPKPILSPELGYTFDGKAELLGAMLHTGNESNFQKLLRGRGWGILDVDGNLDRSKWDTFIDRLQKEGVLTKEDYDFLQSIWDLNEELKPLAQKAHKSMYGYYFNEVTADELKTPYGNYRGGYVPAIADSFMATDQAAREEKESLEKSNNSFMFPTAGRGFTKSRVEGYAAPLVIDIRRIPSHIDKLLRFVYIEPRVKEVSRMLWDKDFRKSLDDFDSTVAGDMLIPWLQRSAQQMVSVPAKGNAGKAADRFFKYLRRTVGLQAMFANVTNTLQQFTGITIAGLKVNPRHLNNALWIYTRNPTETIERIVEKSKFMATRMTPQAAELMQQADEILLNPTAAEKAKDWSIKHGYFLQSMAQNVVDTITWMGAYNQAVENGADERSAVRQADSAVRLTQGSMSPEDISRYEAGPSLARLFTMFYSYFNMQANLLGTEFLKVHRDMGLKKGAGKALYIYTLGFMLPAVISEVLVKAMSGKFDEDDDDEYIDDFIGMFFSSQFRSAAALIPIGGQVATASINAFNDKWYDDRISTSPAVAMIESAASAPHSVYEAVFDRGNKKKAIRDSLTLLGLLSGMPTTALAKPAGYLSDVSERKARPTGPIDFTRGLITGKSGK